MVSTIAFHRTRLRALTGLLVPVLCAVILGACAVLPEMDDPRDGAPNMAAPRFTGVRAPLIARHKGIIDIAEHPANVQGLPIEDDI